MPDSSHLIIRLFAQGIGTVSSKSLTAGKDPQQLAGLPRGVALSLTIHNHSGNHAKTEYIFLADYLLTLLHLQHLLQLIHLFS